MQRHLDILKKGGKYLICVLAFISCARSMNPDIERGGDYNFKPGYPEAQLSALGLIDEDNQGHVDITADIVKESLIFRKGNEKLYSEVMLDIELLSSKEQELVRSLNSKQLIEKNADSTVHAGQELFNYKKQIPVEPGSYKLRLTVTDLHSQKESVTENSVHVPDPNGESAGLTSVKMFEKDKKRGWSAVTGYNVQSKVDSIKFVAQAITNKPSEIIDVQTELVRFEADTSVAEPMHVNFISFKKQEGINYDKETVIQSTKRRLSDVGTVFLEFKFGDLDKGNYRFRIFENEKEIFKGRDFGVKSENYPTLKTSEEFARPLAYIMPEDEYKDMMAIQDSDTLKKAIDKFWLKNIGNKSKAKNVIQLYYSRVEEANKQFSNFKEGWKTDRGMIYILFGPPWNIKENLRTDNIQWSYSFDHYESKLNFIFYPSREKSEFYPFNNYILKRDNSYFNLQYQQIELWKNGLIITTRIGI